MTAADGSRAETLLDLPLPANDADAPTVRDYLIALLREAWEQGENFCKRPFGNSGWQYEIYTPMVKAGLVPGTVDSDGELDDVDTRAADALMDEAIQALGAARVDVEGHIIEVRETGWTIMHPLACRPRLFDCEVNRAAERDLTAQPAELGRFRCDAATGQFAIGGRVATDG
jgi:hypothetical protein